MKPKKNNLDSNGFLVGPDGWLNRASVEWTDSYLFIRTPPNPEPTREYKLTHAQIRAALQCGFYRGASWQKLRKQPLKDKK